MNYLWLHKTPWHGASDIRNRNGANSVVFSGAQTPDSHESRAPMMPFGPYLLIDSDWICPRILRILYGMPTSCTSVRSRVLRIRFTDLCISICGDRPKSYLIVATLSHRTIEQDGPHAEFAPLGRFSGIDFYWPQNRVNFYAIGLRYFESLREDNVPQQVLPNFVALILVAFMIATSLSFYSPHNTTGRGKYNAAVDRMISPPWEGPDADVMSPYRLARSVSGNLKP